jgi:adenosine kinase
MSTPKRARVVPEVPKGALVAMGNPLLDISATVPDSFLAKYALTSNTQILAEPSHLPIFAEIVKEFPVTYVAGGSAQNTVRVAQWMLAPQPATAMIGCVGKDENARILRAQAEGNGVHVAYVEDADTPTGTCAALVTGKDRTLVANIAAANNFKEEHLKQPERWALIENALFVYVEGYFMTVSPAAIQAAAAHCATNNKVFMLNLSAQFIPQFFFEPLSAAIPYCDYVFGNETEAKAFAESSKWQETDIAQIALKIAALPKVNAARARSVVITQGHEPTIVVVDGVVSTFPVLLIDSSLIVDTNGAGDAFVGGFLSQLVLGEPLNSCVQAGQYCAREIIQQTGCTFPSAPAYPGLPTDN